MQHMFARPTCACRVAKGKPWMGLGHKGGCEQQGVVAVLMISWQGGQAGAWSSGREGRVEVCVEVVHIHVMTRFLCRDKHGQPVL
jgi:hypothetical protein